MSLQIRDAANPAARAELRERLAELLNWAMAVQYAENQGGGENAPSREELKTNTATLLYALTGHQPTQDEVDAMFP